MTSQRSGRERAAISRSGTSCSRCPARRSRVAISAIAFVRARAASPSFGPNGASSNPLRVPLSSMRTRASNPFASLRHSPVAGVGIVFLSVRVGRCGLFPAAEELIADHARDAMVRGVPVQMRERRHDPKLGVRVLERSDG